MYILRTCVGTDTRTQTVQQHTTLLDVCCSSLSLPSSFLLIKLFDKADYDVEEGENGKRAAGVLPLRRGSGFFFRSGDFPLCDYDGQDDMTQYSSGTSVEKKEHGPLRRAGNRSRSPRFLFFAGYIKANESGGEPFSTLHRQLLPE